MNIRRENKSQKNKQLHFRRHDNVFFELFFMLASDKQTKYV